MDKNNKNEAIASWLSGVLSGIAIVLVLLFLVSMFMFLNHTQLLLVLPVVFLAAESVFATIAYSRMHNQITVVAYLAGLYFIVGLLANIIALPNISPQKALLATIIGSLIGLIIKKIYKIYTVK